MLNWNEIDMASFTNCSPTAQCCLLFKLAPFALLNTLGTWILLHQSSLPHGNFFFCTWTSATQLSLIEISLLSGHCSEERYWLWIGKESVDNKDYQIRSLMSGQVRPRQPFPPWLAANTAAGLQTHPHHSAANKSICCLASHLSTRYRVTQRRWAGNHLLKIEAHWMCSSSTCF